MEHSDKCSIELSSMHPCFMPSFYTGRRPRILTWHACPP